MYRLLRGKKIEFLKCQTITLKIIYDWLVKRSNQAGEDNSYSSGLRAPRTNKSSCCSFTRNRLEARKYLWEQCFLGILLIHDRLPRAEKKELQGFHQITRDLRFDLERANTKI